MIPKKHLISIALIITTLATTLGAKNLSQEPQIQDYLFTCFDQGAYRSGLVALENHKTKIPKPIYHWWKGFLYLVAENYYRSEQEYAHLDTLIATWDAKSPLRFLSLTGQAEALMMQGDKKGANIFAETALKFLPRLRKLKPKTKWPRFQIAMAMYSLGHHLRIQMEVAKKDFGRHFAKIDSMTRAARTSLQPILPSYPGVDAWLHIQDGNYYTDLVFFDPSPQSDSTPPMEALACLEEAITHYQTARKLLKQGFRHKHFLLTRTYANEFLARIYAKASLNKDHLITAAMQEGMDTIHWKGTTIPFSLSPADLSYAATFGCTQEMFVKQDVDLVLKMTALEPLLKIAEEGHCERLADPVLQHPNYQLEYYGLHSWFPLVAMHLLRFQASGDSVQLKNAWNLLTAYQDLGASNQITSEKSASNLLQQRGQLLNAKRTLLERLWLLDAGIEDGDSALVQDSLVYLQNQLNARERTKGQGLNHLTNYRKKMNKGDAYIGLFRQWDYLMTQILTPDTFALTFFKEEKMSTLRSPADSIQDPSLPFPKAALWLRQDLNVRLRPIKGNVKHLLLRYGQEFQGLGLEQVISGAFFGKHQTHPCLPTVLEPDFHRLNERDTKPVSILLAVPNYEGTVQSKLSGATMIEAISDSLELNLRKAENTEQTKRGLEAGKVVIFFGHAEMNVFQPQRSSLLIKDSLGHTLQAVNLTDMKVKSPLVILAGCQTGAGKTTVMEGPHSLARYLLSAGAGSVIATAWEVDDRATAAILSLFLKNLNNGMRVSQALADAQNTFRKKYAGTEWNHTYYWAGIQQFGGDGIVLLQKKHDFHFAWILLIVIPLALVILFGTRIA